MAEPLIITSDSPLLQALKFKPYRSAEERRVRVFEPKQGEPQTLEIPSKRGTLVATAGDMLISEMDTPDHIWPVARGIFDASYEIIRPGVCIKKAITWLVPLTDLTGGDPDRKVTVVSLEGPNTVRAGEYYLAKGVMGEIWAYPVRKIGKIMKPVEE